MGVGGCRLEQFPSGLSGCFKKIFPPSKDTLSIGMKHAPFLLSDCTHFESPIKRVIGHTSVTAIATKLVVSGFLVMLKDKIIPMRLEECADLALEGQHRATQRGKRIYADWEISSPVFIRT